MTASQDEPRHYLPSTSGSDAPTSLGSHTRATSVSGVSLPIPGISYRPPQLRPPSTYRVRSEPARSIGSQTDSLDYSQSRPISLPTRSLRSESFSSASLDYPESRSVPSALVPQPDSDIPDTNPAEAHQTTPFDQNPDTQSSGPFLHTSSDGHEIPLGDIDFSDDLPPPPIIGHQMGDPDPIEVLKEVRLSLSYLNDSVQTSLKTSFNFQARSDQTLRQILQSSTASQQILIDKQSAFHEEMLDIAKVEMAEFAASQRQFVESSLAAQREASKKELALVMKALEQISAKFT